MKDPLPITASIGELYNPAMEIETQAEADEYFQRLVDRQMVQGTPRAEAESRERLNLRWWSGYDSRATNTRVHRLFKLGAGS